MKIKICGLFRDKDIEYANEAKPDFAGFVFAASRRQVNGAHAARLRKNLLPGIVPVGVFVDAALQDIVSLYKDGVISIAQLHGNEDDCYIAELKGLCGVPARIQFSE
ncbi:hypothetical protein AGMMS50212_14990 [Spirochaetia bacterium]|nr:hypothetical protein AGMMS50212_14990 [Spirochaetia bacterium]